MSNLSSTAIVVALAPALALALTEIVAMAPPGGPAGGRASAATSAATSSVTSGATSGMKNDATSDVSTSDVSTSDVTSRDVTSRVTTSGMTSGVASGAYVGTVRPAVVLHLVDRADLTVDARDDMMRESERLWRAAGVSVRWAIGVTRAASSTDALPEGDVPVALDAPPHEVTHLYVICTREVAALAAQDARDGFHARRPLASILFVDGKPTTLIRAYPLAVEHLLDAIRWEDRSLVQRPPRLRSRLMGRVLGRAVAHELGHFLFASADHAVKGLMRATHRTDHLLAASDGPFRIVAPRPQPCDVVAVTGRRAGTSGLGSVNP